MLDVRVDEKNLGSMHWELPRNFADKLAEFSPEMQRKLLGVITQLMRGHMNLVVCAFGMGENALFQLVESNLQQALKFDRQIRG